VAGTLRLEADASVTEMAEAIQAEVAEYSQPLDGAYAGALTRAVRHAADTFIAATGPAPDNMDSIPWRRGHLNPHLEQPILTLDRLCWCVSIRPARADRGLDDKRPPAREGHSFPSRPAGRGRAGRAR
jgi:hypothetical protein